MIHCGSRPRRRVILQSHGEFENVTVMIKHPDLTVRAQRAWPSIEKGGDDGATFSIQGDSGNSAEPTIVLMSRRGKPAGRCALLSFRITMIYNAVAMEIGHVVE